MDNSPSRMANLWVTRHYGLRDTGQLQPLVPPQVLHFMQVPLRTSV